MYEIRPNRFGQFLFLTGLLLMVVFFATDQMRDPQFCLFGLGLGGIVLGGYLVWRSHVPQALSADRFRTLRRMAKGFSEWNGRRRAAAATRKRKR